MPLPINAFISLQHPATSMGNAEANPESNNINAIDGATPATGTWHTWQSSFKQTPALLRIAHVLLGQGQSHSSCLSAHSAPWLRRRLIPSVACALLYYTCHIVASRLSFDHIVLLTSSL